MSAPRFTALACDTTALGHLARVIEGHFPRQSQHDGDADLARRQAFTAAASDPAQRYMRLRLQAQDAENRRKRFEAIARRAATSLCDGRPQPERIARSRESATGHTPNVDDPAIPRATTSTSSTSSSTSPGGHGPPAACCSGKTCDGWSKPPSHWVRLAGEDDRRTRLSAGPLDSSSCSVIGTAGRRCE